MESHMYFQYKCCLLESGRDQNWGCMRDQIRTQSQRNPQNLCSCFQCNVLIMFHYSKHGAFYVTHQRNPLFEYQWKTATNAKSSLLMDSSGTIIYGQVVMRSFSQLLKCSGIYHFLLHCQISNNGKTIRASGRPHTVSFQRAQQDISMSKSNLNMKITEGNSTDFKCLASD